MDVWILADALNWPLVVAWGFFWFVPLNLLVAGIEVLVIRRLLGLRVADTYRRVFFANVLSTFAGAIVYGFQDALLYLTGLFQSVATMIRWFPAAAIGMIVVYYAKSVLVEGAVVATRKFSEATQHSRRSIFRAVAIANIASYFVVGPVYYFTTRPTFNGIEATDTANWTANPNMIVYYIDPTTRHIRRKNLDGTNEATLVPFAARDFVVSGDEGAAAYRGEDGTLFAYLKGWHAPKPVWKTKSQYLIRNVAISPDNQHIVYVQPEDESRIRTNWTVRIFDSLTGTLSIGPSLMVDEFFGPSPAFSTDGRFLVLRSSQKTSLFDARPPWHEATRSQYKERQTAENYRQTGTGMYSGWDDWGATWTDDRCGDVEIRAEPFIGSALTVKRGQSVILVLRCDYGLLKLGFPHFVKPRFLPTGTEAMVEWNDQLYVLDYERKRLGLVGYADRYALRPAEVAASAPR